MRALIEKDPRLAAFDKAKTRWFTFQLTSDGDLHAGLDYLGRAFDAAGISKKTR
jgi:hypothetical protein